MLPCLQHGSPQKVGDVTVLITTIPLLLDILVLSAFPHHKGCCVNICENKALLTLHTGVLLFCFVFLDLILAPSWGSQ